MSLEHFENFEKVRDYVNTLERVRQKMTDLKKVLVETNHSLEDAEDDEEDILKVIKELGSAIRENRKFHETVCAPDLLEHYMEKGEKSC